MSKKLLIFFGLFLFSNLGICEESSPCPAVVFHGEESLSFSKNEKRFICGDENVLDWSKIPNYQKKQHINAILQTRGYHLARMEEKGATLHVYIGEIKKVRKINFHGFEPSLELLNNTTSIGKKLTPTVLNEIEAMTKTYLAERGHPCAKISSTADPETEIVDVTAVLGKEYFFTTPDEPSFSELSERVFPRYSVFLEGRLFDQRLLSLTAQRILKDGVVTFSRLSVRCDVSGDEEEEKKEISHDIVLGKPRIFRVGVGFNTDIGPFTTLSWTHARLSQEAAKFQAQLQASFVEQSISLSSQFYPLIGYPRGFLRPRLKISHFDEETFESVETELSLRAGTWWESESTSSRLAIGPSYVYTDLISGVGDSEGYLAVHVEKSLWSHDHEYFAGSPRSGFSLDLKATHAGEATGASFTASRFELSGKCLRNIASYTPERLILGTRFKLISTIKDDADSLADLPLEFREFIGGSSDVRGFSRKSLPNDDEGVLTVAYAGLELRSNSLLPYGLQPLLFFDLAAVSKEEFEISSPYYHSPGLGLRWSAFIGVFRFSYARGYEFGDESSEDVNNQFHLSYGEEF